MNKLLLIKQILCTLETVHQNAITATERAQDTATNKNNVAENKYDTLGLEAAYLAHGQAQRVAECQMDLSAYKTLVATDFDDQAPIAIGTLIQLKDENDLLQYFFLGPAAGGLKFSFQQEEIMLITPSAPLGKALLGSFVEEEVALAMGGQIKHYQIMAIS